MAGSAIQQTFIFGEKMLVVEELQKNNECMIEELYRKIPEKKEVLYFYYAIHKPGKCERQIKEKLKQIGAQMFPTELEADRYFRFSDR